MRNAQVWRKKMTTPPTSSCGDVRRGHFVSPCRAAGRHRVCGGGALPVPGRGMGGKGVRLWRVRCAQWGAGVTSGAPTFAGGYAVWLAIVRASGVVSLRFVRLSRWWLVAVYSWAHSSGDVRRGAIYDARAAPRPAHGGRSGCDYPFRSGEDGAYVCGGVVRF